jgi:hypothetical protein
MFSVKKRKQLIRKLQHPVRRMEIRDLAATLMEGSRYRSVETFIAALA